MAHHGVIGDGCVGETRIKSATARAIAGAQLAACSAGGRCARLAARLDAVWHSRAALAGAKLAARVDT